MDENEITRENRRLVVAPPAPADGDCREPDCAWPAGRWGWCRRHEERPLLVGECHPLREGDPLAPEPGRAGNRLRLVLGLDVELYLTRYDRANLCVGDWDDVAAVRRARELIYRRGVLVLLGARVARAFDRVHAPFSLDEASAVVELPHPSGRCRTWNDPTAALRARDVMLRAGCVVDQRQLELFAKEGQL